MFPDVEDYLFFFMTVVALIFLISAGFAQKRNRSLELELERVKIILNETVKTCGDAWIGKPLTEEEIKRFIK